MSPLTPGIAFNGDNQEELLRDNAVLVVNQRKKCGIQQLQNGLAYQ